MRVRMGGPRPLQSEEPSEESCSDTSGTSLSLSQWTDHPDTQGDHFLDIHGSVVARIAAKFEAGFGVSYQYPVSTYQGKPSCLRRTSDHRKGCSVSFSDNTTVFSVERFNDSYYEIDDYDDEDHRHDESDSDDEHSQGASTPQVSRQYLPDDMFTPEESSPRKSLASSSNLTTHSLPKAPLLVDTDEAPPSPMSVISLTLYGRQKIEFDAAVTIQRSLRGWHQRRTVVRLRWLEHRIATHHERTQAELDQVRRDTRRRQRTLQRQLQQQRKRQVQTNTVLRESQHIVAFLRKENNHWREKNDALAEAIANLQGQNSRIAGANDQSDSVVVGIREYCREQQEAHEQWLETLAEYKAAIELLETALEERKRYQMAEARIKIACRRAIASVVDKMSEALPDDELTEAIMTMAIEGDDRSMSCLAPYLDGSDSTRMQDTEEDRSFSQLSRSSLAHGLSESVAALRYESDSEDEQVKQYATSAT